MGSLSIQNIFTPATRDQWLTQLLSNASVMGLATTQWQAGGIGRTFLAIMANACTAFDQVASTISQGGFLDFAAQVTPDPSVVVGAPAGWLDILADGSYNAQRIPGSYASGTIAIANTTATSYGPYQPFTYHVANPTTGATYSNTASLTIGGSNFVGGGIVTASNASPVQIATTSSHGLATGATVTIAGVTGNTGAIGTFLITVVDATHFTLNGSAGTGSGTGGTVNVPTLATFQADVSGQGGTSAASAINQAVTANVGVSASNPQGFTGTAPESNSALVARCRLKLQSLSPNGPSGAYAYFALSASQILAALPTPIVLANPITRALVQGSAAIGTVTVTVANAAGAVSGTPFPITGATNASPIQITTAAAHGLSNGALVTIQGVLGNTAANGVNWTIGGASGSVFTLTGSTGNGAYTANSGTVYTGDLGLVDGVIQSYAVPTAVTEITQSATARAITITATVYVPAAQVTAYQSAVQTALTNYFAALPIGGLNTDAATNVIPTGAIEGVLYAAGSIAGAPSYVRGITNLSVTGGVATIPVTGDQQINPTDVATISFGPSAITVQPQ